MSIPSGLSAQAGSAAAPWGRRTFRADGVLIQQAMDEFFRSSNPFYDGASARADTPTQTRQGVVVLVGRG